MLLVFAIGFNGYISVAYAFAEDVAHDVKVFGLTDDHHIQKDVHAADQNSDASCKDCSHCCVMHIYTLPDYSIKYFSPTVIGWVSPLNDEHRERYAGSLFRPPIALI